MIDENNHVRQSYKNITISDIKKHLNYSVFVRILYFQELSEIFRTILS